MKKLFFLVMILGFYSCSTDSDILIPEETSEFFPLQVGNRWEYISSLDSSIWKYEITDTKVFNQHVYFERVLTFSDGTKETEYFRVTDSNVVLIYYEGEDYIYIDFNRAIGEEWNSYDDFFGFIRQRNITTTVEAGTFTNVTEVFMDNRSYADIFSFNRYSPGVGLIEVFRFRFNLSLVNATVNGINYPQ